jgi:hypothetical protein
MKAKKRARVGMVMRMLETRIGGFSGRWLSIFTGVPFTFEGQQRLGFCGKNYLVVPSLATHGSKRAGNFQLTKF